MKTITLSVVYQPIEYWAEIGKNAEENPDLPVGMIVDILVSIEEANLGLLNDYCFK